MRILIAPDSFKDSLDATGVAGSLKKGMEKILPEALFTLCPMADGGEGTVEALIRATSGTIHRLKVHDPLLRKRASFFGITGDGQTAVIEMAAASGLEMLKEHERDPWKTSSFGTGELIQAALDKGCRKFFIGIGGSATNDAGAGMAAALGVRFLNEAGKEVIPTGGSLNRIRTIDLSGLDPRIGKSHIRVACDVNNPLTGPSGASRVYGPQKGADPEMAELLDRNLAYFHELISTQLGREVDKIPGAGAAGGLGAGGMVFLGASLEEGFGLVAALSGLKEKIVACDLVVTGEGKMDEQTAHGKTAHGVARMAKEHGRPVIAVAGTLAAGAGNLYREGFDALVPIAEKPVSLEEALRSAPELLERAGERIARLLVLGRKMG